MTNKPRITAAQQAQIVSYARELIPQISDFANDIAMEVTSEVYPDYVERLDGELGDIGEEELLDCEDTVTGVIILRILDQIRWDM